jgi:hypothetical protein
LRIQVRTLAQTNLQNWGKEKWYVSSKLANHYGKPPLLTLRNFKKHGLNATNERQLPNYETCNT